MIEKIILTIYPLVTHHFEPHKINNTMKLQFEFAISGILAAITLWYNQGKPIPSKELVVIIRSLLMNGVALELHQNSDVLPGRTSE